MALRTVSSRFTGLLTGSLRTKIIVWFFVPTAIILAAVALVNFYSYQKVTEDLVFERNRDLTQLLAARLAIKFGSFPELLRDVSHASGFSEQADADSQANLVQASGDLAVFDAGVLILDSSGTITAAYPYRPDLIGQDWSGHPIIRQVSGSQESVISDVLRDGSNDSQVIEVAMPMSGDHGEFMGSMIGMFRLRATNTSALYREISKLRIGNGRSYIVDGNGRVIYHDDPERLGADLVDQQPVIQVLRGEAGAIRTRTGGTDVVSAFSPIPGTAWGLVTEESWSALTSGSRNFQRFLLLLLALGIAVPAGLVGIGLKRVMRPIEELKSAAREVARGNFGQTIAVHSGDEIEELANEFNSMAEQLQGSYAALGESEELYRVVVETAQDAMSITVGTEQVFVNNAWLKLMGVEKFEPGTISLGQYVAPEDRDKVVQRNLARQRGEEVDDVYEFKILRNDGQRRTVQASSVAINYKDQPASLAILRDVTEYKQAQAELQALFTISSILAEPGSYEEKMHSVMRELARVAEADWVNLRISNSHDPGLEPFALSITSAGDTTPSLPSLREGFSTDAIEAMKSGEPVVVNDYQSHPNAHPVTLANGAKSMMLIPIKQTGDTPGAAGVASREADHFNPERVRLLTAIVDGFGNFLEKARLDGQIRDELERRRRTEAELLQRSDQLEALFKISSILNQPGAYAPKLNSVMQELLRVAEAAWVTLGVRDPQEGGVRVLFRVGTDRRSFAPIHLGKGLTLQAMESGEPVVANDYQSHPNAEPTTLEDGAKSVISLPIKGTEETLAVASVVSREADHFNPERVRLLTAIVDGFGVFLESARLQQDLLDSNDQLSDALDVLKSTQEYVVQQERLHALGTMASGIAHDFNNALAPILGYSEMILEDADKFDESTVKYLREISTSAKDAGAVVGRLREFYRAREGSELMMAVDINDIVARTISLTQPRWRDMAQVKGIDIQLTTELASGLPEVSGDEPELRTALGNVIFNAVDAMPNGGTITLRTFQDSEEVVLEVTDTGTGMSDEVLRRAMEPFFTTKEEQGTGMGLAMVYGTLQRHNGELEVRSELGQGTTVGFRLPVRTEVTVSPTLPTAAEPIPAGLRFLVVDDESRVRDMVGEFLRREGSIVETATNGRDALEKFNQNEFDVVITDRGMPEMNGDALAAAIKAETPRLPIIMLTGFGEMMISAGEKPPGVDCLLGKPVTPAALRQAVAAVRAEYAEAD